MDVLLLCTANVCRSPMAEALLRHLLADREVDASVHSAGLLPGGGGPSASAVETLQGWGLDLSAHESRTVTAEMVAAADLVLGMTREHVREAVLLRPDAWEKAFTLKELVRRGEAVGPRLPDEPFGAWLVRAGEGRNRSDLVGASREDDVPDPIGRPAAFFQRTAEDLAELLSRLVDVAWPRVTAEASRP